MTLENKLGITNSAELAREEERISKKKAVELFESGALDKLAPGRFASLQAIHKALFENIYDFAGELRTVNLAKGNFRFAPLMYIKSPARQPLSHVLPRSYGLKYCCSHNHTPLFLGGSIHRRCSKPSVHSVTLRCKCRISLLPHDCLLSGRKVACIRALPANKCWHASGAAIQKYVRWF